MNKVSRRGILKMLPTAPWAVQEAQRQAEKLVNAGINPATDDGTGEYLFGRRRLGGSEASKSISGKAIAKLLRYLGVPEWKKQEIRRYARSSRQLDPDIAAMRSISLSAKLEIQWRRNERKGLDRMFNGLELEDEQNEFLRKHNIDWL